MKGKRRTCVEYVVIAAIIAAAIVAAAVFFGKGVMNMFGVAGSAATGDHSSAAACECRAADGNAAAARQSACADKAFSERKASSVAEENGKWRAEPKDSTVTPVPIPDDGGSTPSEEFKQTK